MIEGKICILLFGLAGSGKGTQAGFLSNKIGLLHISPGEMLRQMSAAGTLPRDVVEVMNSGSLVDSKRVTDIVVGETRLKLVGSEYNGVILDGYPRNEEQDDYFIASLRDGESVDVAVYLQISQDILIERLNNRVQCGNCGTIYNILLAPPHISGKCDKCGSNDLRKRGDDSDIDVIRKRFEAFNKETYHVVQKYERFGVLHTIDANQKPDVLCEKIISIVEKYVD